MDKKVVIFARVSTSNQEYDRQVNELTVLAANNNWKVCACFMEKLVEQNQIQKEKNFYI